MNRRENFIAAHGLNPIEDMNRWQGAGVVSDNAVMPCDGANADGSLAVKFLANHLPEKRCSPCGALRAECGR